jgi:hypothetical protein
MKMKTVFSTNNVHARDGFDFWHGVACKNLVDHDSLPECRLAFGAQIEVGYLGNLELVLISHSCVVSPYRNLDQRSGDSGAVRPPLPYLVRKGFADPGRRVGRDIKASAELESVF